jgi:hypothetical protein
MVFIIGVGQHLDSFDLVVRNIDKHIVRTSAKVLGDLAL